MLPPGESLHVHDNLDISVFNPHPSPASSRTFPTAHSSSTLPPAPTASASTRNCMANPAQIPPARQSQSSQSATPTSGCASARWATSASQKRTCTVRSTAKTLSKSSSCVPSLLASSTSNQLPDVLFPPSSDQTRACRSSSRIARSWPRSTTTSSPALLAACPSSASQPAS